MGRADMYGTGSVLCKMGGADMQCHFAPKNGNGMLCLTSEYTLSNIIMSEICNSMLIQNHTLVMNNVLSLVIMIRHTMIARNYRPYIIAFLTAIYSVTGNFGKH